MESLEELKAHIRRGFFLLHAEPSQPLASELPPPSLGASLGLVGLLGCATRRLKCFFFARRKCALSGLPRTCKHRIMLGDSGNYYYISPSCRARVSLPPSQAASTFQNHSRDGGALGSTLKLPETCRAGACSCSRGGSWSMTGCRSPALLRALAFLQATCPQRVRSPRLDSVQGFDCFTLF